MGLWPICKVVRGIKPKGLWGRRHADIITLVTRPSMHWGFSTSICFASSVSGLGINSNGISSSLMQCLQLASRIAQPPPFLLLFFYSSPVLESTRPLCLTRIPSLFALTSLESHMASWHSMPSLCQEHEYLSFQPTSPFWTPNLYTWVSCHLQSSSSWTWQSPSRHSGLPSPLNLLHTLIRVLTLAAMGPHS